MFSRHIYYIFVYVLFFFQKRGRGEIDVDEPYEVCFKRDKSMLYLAPSHMARMDMKDIEKLAGAEGPSSLLAPSQRKKLEVEVRKSKNLFTSRSSAERRAKREADLLAVNATLKKERDAARKDLADLLATDPVQMATFNAMEELARINTRVS